MMMKTLKLKTYLAAAAALLLLPAAAAAGEDPAVSGPAAPVVSAADGAGAESGPAETVAGDGEWESALVGGWELPADTAVTEAAREMLARALKDCGGAEYKPVALLGTQAVAGTNYCFLCRTSGIAPETGAGYALVYVYEDLRGEPEILDISGLSIGA